jgi:ankyrin repeat protein
MNGSSSAGAPPGGAMLMIAFALQTEPRERRNVFLRAGCPWEDIAGGVATAFHADRARVASLTLYDSDDDDLSQPVTHGPKFWKYGVNYELSSGHYFLVDLHSEAAAPVAAAPRAPAASARDRDSLRDRGARLPRDREGQPAAGAGAGAGASPNRAALDAATPPAATPPNRAERLKRSAPSPPEPSPPAAPKPEPRALPPTPPDVPAKKPPRREKSREREEGGGSSCSEEGEGEGGTEESESGPDFEESELLQAFVANDKAGVNRLLSCESVHDTDEQGRTLMHMACRQGMEGLVRAVVDLGGDPDVQDRAGRTPLHYACKYDHQTTVKYLVDIKVNLNIADKDKMLALHYACIAGCVEITKLLVESGHCEIDSADKRGNTAVHYCCDTRNYPLAEYLTETGGANIDKVNDDGLSAFGIVHNSGTVGFASVLMEKAALVSVQRNTLSKTRQLAQQSIRGDWATVLSLVLDGVADIHAGDADGKSVLSYACEAGSLEVVRAIVERGGRIQHKDTFGKTCLHYCCDQGHCDVARYLIVETGRAAVNDPDGSGHTELFYACTGVGDADLVKLLAENGGDFRSAAGSAGSLRLLCKALSRDRDLVEWLIKECNFDIELLYFGEDEDGGMDLSSDSDAFYSWAWEVKKRLGDWLTESLCAALQSRPDDSDEAQDLIRRGADVNVTLAAGCCPLHDACVRGRDEYVTFLIKHGALCTVVDSWGNTPLHIASYFGHLEIIRWLKKSGAMLPVKNTAGYTPLHLACASAQLQVVKWLVDRGANIHDQANNGFTPFLLACESGDMELVRWIEPRMKQAAFVPEGDHTNAVAYKPIDHSVYSGNLELVQWWLNKRACPESVGTNYLTRTRRVNQDKQAAKVVTDFRMSCFRGDLEACKRGVSGGVDINCTDSRAAHSRALAPQYALDAADPMTRFLGLPPLHICASLGHEEVVNLLLEQPAVRYSMLDGETGRSAVHVACLGGYSTIVTRLLKVGQFSEIQLDAYGNSLLHLSVMSKNESFIISLAERYPLLDEDLENGEGKSCLRMAAELGLTAVLAWFRDNPKHARLIDELCSACSSGNIVVMNRLVSQGANVNTGDNDGMSPIHFAAANNQLLIVTRLLELRCNLNCVNVFSMSALHLAAEGGHNEVVRCLVYGKADMNLVDVNGMTPFLLCCSHGKVEIATFLIDQGVVTNTINRKGQNALHLACLSDSFTMVKCIIERCREVMVDARDKNFLRPLDVATERFQMEMITCIQCAQIICYEERQKDLERSNELELKKAEERAKNQAELKEIYMRSEGEREIERMQREGLKDANTALFLDACYKNQNELVQEMLMADTVNPNCQNADGFTALHLACVSGNTAMVRQLLLFHIIIDVKNKHGCTALYYACASGNDEISLLLVENGADYSAVAKDGTTALQCICAKDRATLLRMLFKRDPNIDVNARGGGGSSLLQVACINGSDNVAGILVKKGAAVRGDVDASRSSLLHLAAATGSVKLCQSLLESEPGAGRELLAARDGDGFTPLMRACTAGHRKLAQFLVSEGADLHDTDPVGNTCLHLAAIAGSAEVCTWLTERGLNVFSFNDDKTNVLVIVKVKRHVELLKWLKAHLETVRAFMDLCSGGDLHSIRRFMEQTRIHPMATNECFATAMHFACGAGELVTAKHLLSLDSALDEGDDEGLTPLHWATAGGHEQAAKWLLGRGARIEHKTHDGRNLLHRAAFHGQSRLVTVLLNNRAFPYPIDDTTDNGFTPFFDACTSGHLRAAELLLLKGAQLMQMLPNGYNIIHILCRQGRHAILSWLLGNYSVSLAKYLDHGSDKNGTTPFMCACINGSVDALKALEASGLDLGAALDRQTRKGDTALHLACFHGHLAAAQWLLGRGADPAALNTSRHSPLKVAILAGRLEVANWLDDGSEIIPVESTHGPPPAAAARGAGTGAEAEAASNRDRNSARPAAAAAGSRADVDAHAQQSMAQLTLNNSSSNSSGSSSSSRTQPQTQTPTQLQPQPQTRRPEREKPADPFSIRPSKKSLMASSKNSLGSQSASFSADNENVSDVSASSAPGRAGAGAVSRAGARKEQPDRRHPDPFAPAAARPQGQGQTARREPLQSAASKLSRRAGQGQGYGLGLGLVSEVAAPAAAVIPARTVLRNAATARSESGAGAGAGGIHAASAGGDLRLVEELVAGGGRVDELNAQGMTPLYVACDKQHEGVALSLIRHGASLSAVCRSTGDTPLHRLCYRGMSRLLNLILEQPSLGSRMDLDCRNDTGSCPLHIAVSGFGDLAMIKYLLELGADAGAKDADGMTALHFACKSHKLDTAKLLLSWSAPINAQNKAGNTPLMLAVTADDGPIAKYLVEVKHAALTPKNTSGDTALHLACKAGRLSMTEWLVVHNGMDPTVRNNAKLSAVNCAEMGGYDHLAAKLEQWQTPAFRRSAK